MKRKCVIPIMLAIATLLAASLACAGGATPEPTAVPPTSTNTPLPTETPRKVPTSTRTPRPTVTSTPTPAPVGVPVRSNTFEVTVLKARVLTNGVHTGDGYYWTTKPGYLFVELGVKVSNLKTGVKTSMPWQLIYVIEDNGDTWYPNWGGFKAVASGKELDPSSISVSSIESGKDVVEFENDVYLRLIYVVTEKRPTAVQFGFDESPMIEIVVNN